MKNKRGMSGIMTTLIIVLLALVAIGIVWKTVLPIVNKGAESAETEGTYLTSYCEDDEVGGIICNEDEICTGREVTTLDTSRCCIDGECEVP